MVLYPAGQKRTLTLLLSAQNAQFLADRMMPRRDAVAHTPRGGEKLAFAVLGANGLSTLALLALAVKQSRPYAPDAQTAAFAHLNRIAAWAARWLPMGTAWLWCWAVCCSAQALCAVRPMRPITPCGAPRVTLAAGAALCAGMRCALRWNI